MSLRRIRHALVRRVVAPLVTLAMTAGDLAADPTDEDMDEASWFVDTDELVRHLHWIQEDGTHLRYPDLEDVAMWVPDEMAVEIVEMLLKRADPDSITRLLFQVVVSDKHACVELLLANGWVDPSVCNSRAFQLATMHRSLKSLVLLLDDGRVNVDYTDRSKYPTIDYSNALTGAIVRGDASVVRLLLKDGRANPMSSDLRIVYDVPSDIFSVDPEVRQLLLDDGRVGSGTLIT